MDEKTGTQLQVIAEVARVAAGESLTVALRGGWALEFLVGHVSRPHVDVDFVAWSHDADRLEHALIANGFTVAPAPASHRAVQRDFAKHGEDVQIALLEPAGEGTLIPPGHPEWPLSSGLLAGPWMTLDGVTCQVSTPEALLDAKEKRPFQGPRGRVHGEGSRRHASAAGADHHAQPGSLSLPRVWSDPLLAQAGLLG